MSFAISMDIYIDDPKTGHHNKFARREYKEFESAEEMATFWEANKSFEREGKQRAKFRKKASKKQFAQIGEELGRDVADKLIADARRSVGVESR